MARKTKLTDEVQDDICAALSIGCTYDAAARNAGVTYTTFRNWILAAEEARKIEFDGGNLTRDQRRKIEFLEAVEGAKADALIEWQQVVYAASKLDPVWAWKMLQVRASADYAMPQQQIDVTSKGEQIGRITTIEVVHHVKDDAPASRD